MHDPLAPLLADGVIDAVVSRLKSGKEADLFLVEHRGEVLAAKVYKARQDRNFRNNAAYTEGRQVRNTRTQRAMDKGSRFGRAAAEEAWKTKEADALHALHAAGVRVPKPVIFYEGVLVMELVLGPDGHPAPRLVDAAIPAGQAAALYADLRAQAIRMLTCDLVHGDLSPYNVLLGHAGPVVIDFPQVIGAAHNRQAERFFERDLEAIRRFFAQHDPGLQAAASDAREIWRAYERRELTPDFVPVPRPVQAPKGHGGGHGAAHGQGHGQPHGRERERGGPPRERRQEQRPEARQAQGSHAGHGGEPRREHRNEARPERRHDAPQGPRGDQRQEPRRDARQEPRREQGPGARRGPPRGDRPEGARRDGQGRPPGPGGPGGPPRQGPARDRPRSGPPARTVIVERVGPRLPTSPSGGSPPAAPRGHPRHQGGGHGGQGGHGGRGPKR